MRRLIALAALLAMSCACARAKEVRATVLDAEGRPIAGALLYWEAYRSMTADAVRAADFAFAVTGADGQPAQGRPLRWGWQMNLAVAALADGYRPQVVYLRGGPVLAERVIDGPVFHLARGRGWSEELAGLSIPFAGDEELARRLSSPDAAALREAFQRAAAQLPAGAKAAEREKKAALEAAAAHPMPR